MIRLVLLRHGESTWNRENRFSGWTDVDLTDEGAAQAREAGRRLLESGYRFDVAFTSLLKRAIRTLWLVLDEMDHLLDRLPEKITERSEEIEQWATKIILGFVGNLNIYDMIITNMRKYDEVQLEALIKNSSNEQLNYIKYLGGLLGFFGGLVIWEPFLALTVFGVLGLALYGLDVALMKARPSQA